MELTKLNMTSEELELVFDKEICFELCERYGYLEGKTYFLLWKNELKNEKLLSELNITHSKIYRVKLSMAKKGLLKKGKNGYYSLIPIDLKNKELDKLNEYFGSRQELEK